MHEIRMSKGITSLVFRWAPVVYLEKNIEKYKYFSIILHLDISKKTNQFH
jgi:hypothetical protein